MIRSGEFVSNLSGEATYKSFRPTPLPPNPELVISSDMVKKLVEANRALMRLDTAAKYIPDVKHSYVCNVRRVFDYIEQHPIIDIRKTSEALALSYNTVSTAVNKLVQIGILKDTTNYSRNRVFVYDANSA